MRKIESFIISVFIAVMLPLSASILGWWVMAAVYLSGIFPVREAAILNAAFIGFVIGAILVITYFKELKKRFYTADIRFMALIYLFWSFVSLAFLMGLPVGVVLTGMVAGMYAGRRALHEGAGEDERAGFFRKTCILTVSVTGALTLFVGILTLRDPSTPANLAGMTGIPAEYITGAVIKVLVALFSVILPMLQYFCTKAVIRIAYTAGPFPGKKGNGISNF